ncbi:hypothetical protein [Nocardioides sp. CER19]|uniref:hypothetical protein n=1 Tax=Nocardioides sp. CER19 TaxID=3038538 RepID=UPI00244BE46E|nr:hypothetical protein [Nocardioides sp. CER19]MDH2416595.1 hypothetical protein [Nocardioides sp. CER19]
MDQKARRAAVAKAFRARKVALRKGHWRLPGDDVVWYVDLRSDGPAPSAALRFEIGAWPSALGPEPDGGAVDCALLADVPLEEEPAAATDAIVDRLSALGTVDALAAARRAGELADAHVDQDLRELMGE